MNEEKTLTRIDSEYEKVLAERNKLQAELEKKNDLLLRTAAEFDNYKKRTDREKTGIAEYARAGIIKKLLPIIDNVERSKGAVFYRML